MSEEKVIAGEEENRPSRVIAGEHDDAATQDVATSEATAFEERASDIFQSGGLQKLPAGFDNLNGDWRLINSANPFEVLYLNYKNYKFITPEVVKSNYAILEKFWKEKVVAMNTGANRIAFKNKYGDGTVEYSLQKLKRALDKLSTEAGIEQYYTELNNERLKTGEDSLKDTIEQMLKGGIAERYEIQLCLDRGAKKGLSDEESSRILMKHFEQEHFKPYGTVSGATSTEQLLSVDQWMTQQKSDEAKALEDERQRSKIQILPGRYASTIKEIGTILFDDPKEAKELIKDDLLKPAIAQKDLVLAREVGNISKGTKDIDAAFLNIVYKLNPSLAYRFTGQLVKTVEELCTLIFQTDGLLKQGKEELRKGYIEIWLRETNKANYEVFKKIRDTAENIDLALLSFLYTFSPSLPYRFAGKYLINTTDELTAHINRDKEGWEAGKEELFNSSILVWMAKTRKVTLVGEWYKIKDSYKDNRDAGLEAFLHLLDAKLEHPKITVDKPAFSFPAVQSGRVLTAELTFTNETRGYAEGPLSFSKNIAGVSLSAGKVVLNSATGNKHFKVVLTIDTTVLLKGVNYETLIRFEAPTGQKIEVPVSFRIVFPRNAFLRTTAKYAVIVSVFFIVTRLVLASQYADWLHNSFDYFISWHDATTYPFDFILFSATFFVFVVPAFTGIYYLIKYLKR